MVVHVQASSNQCGGEDQACCDMYTGDVNWCPKGYEDNVQQRLTCVEASGPDDPSTGLCVACGKPGQVCCLVPPQHYFECDSGGGDCDETKLDSYGECPSTPSLPGPSLTPPDSSVNE